LASPAGAGVWAWAVKDALSANNVREATTGMRNAMTRFSPYWARMGPAKTGRDIKDLGAQMPPGTIGCGAYRGDQ